jgi:hypothetical protein
MPERRPRWEQQLRKEGRIEGRIWEKTDKGVLEYRNKSKHNTHEMETLKERYEEKV